MNTFSAFGRLSKLTRFARVFFILSALGMASVVFAEPLEISLTQHVVVGEGSAIERLPADAVSPGDVVEYTASYVNTTDGTLGGVAATVPVPPGMIYLSGSATPAPAEFSEDGAVFLPLSELQRADGSFRPIRAIRWSPRDIPAGETMTVLLRAQVTPIE